MSVVGFCAVGLAVAGQLGIKPGTPPSATVTTPGSERWAGWRAQPPADTALARIGFGACLVQGKPQPIWKAVIAARPQTFAMMGDNVYGVFDSADSAKLEAAYAAQRNRADFGQAIASIPMLATWDDHDYGLNDRGAGFAHKAVAARLYETFWAGSGTLEGARGPGIACARRSDRKGGAYRTSCSTRARLARRSSANQRTTRRRGATYRTTIRKRRCSAPRGGRGLANGCEPADLRLRASRQSRTDTDGSDGANYRTNARSSTR